MNLRRFLSVVLFVLAACWIFTARAQNSYVYGSAANRVVVSGGGGTLAFVNDQGKKWFGGSGTSESTTAITVTAGNLLVITVGWQTIASTISSITGNGNTFTIIDAVSDSTSPQGAQSVYYVKNANSGSTSVTVTWSADPGFGYMEVQQISGASTTSPLDQHTFAIVTPSGGSVSSGNVTTVSNGEFIFGSIFDENAGATFTVGSGFTFPTHGNQGGQGAGEYQVQTSAGAIAAVFGSTDTLQRHIVEIATFH